MPERHTAISTRIFTIPASVAVRGRMMRSLRWPVAILAIPAAISAVLAFSDWRFLVVLFLLVLVGGSAVYAFAWFNTAMSPAAIKAMSPHLVETDDTEIRIIPEDGKLLRSIPIGWVIGIDEIGKYLCVRYRDCGNDASPSMLYIPLDAFPTPDVASRFLSIVLPEHPAFEPASTIPTDAPRE